MTRVYIRNNKEDQGRISREAKSLVRNLDEQVENRQVNLSTLAPTNSTGPSSYEMRKSGQTGKFSIVTSFSGFSLLCNVYVTN